MPESGRAFALAHEREKAASKTWEEAFNEEAAVMEEIHAADARHETDPAVLEALRTRLERAAQATKSAEAGAKAALKDLLETASASQGDKE